jgi:hypothetical protein
MKNVFVLIIKYSGNIDEVKVYDNMPTLMKYLDTCDHLVQDNLKIEDNKNFDTGHIIYTTEVNNIDITTTLPTLGYVPIVVQRHITEDSDLV